MQDVWLWLLVAYELSLTPTTNTINFLIVVLDTNAERLAVVGWYNRQLSASDIAELGGVNPTQLILLAVAAGLVTVGLVSIIS